MKPDYNSQLIIAAKVGDLSKVKYSLKKGANIHADDDVSLRWVSYYGYLDIVKYLIEKGANIHADNDEALKWASKYGHLEIVKYLNRVIKLRKI